MIFTRAVLDYLATQHIGRLATVSPDGQVQNNPTNLVVDADAGTIVIGGGALGRSKKFRNVQRAARSRWSWTTWRRSTHGRPRGIEIRGAAVALTD
ncbi:pyridoxamine 5'-phosphate oxidase family protein [Trebonia sp.]|uniref:pyridoxamine 5'-phosphate oxidase family protein n=1 Tax=Trebonia sp. TaxID=2767075 RepID=UPI003CC6C521